MNCWHCGDQELIWNDDHMMEDDMGAERLVSFFSCPSCHAFVEFYYGGDYEEDSHQSARYSQEHEKN